jgi:hypothetical protein
VVGFGDAILGRGLARGAAARGKRVAFGDGQRIIWGPESAEIFRGNPNVASPGSEGAEDLEWIAHYPGNRLYNRADGDVWVWNYDFRPVPGEIFFDASERNIAATVPTGFVLIEPNVPAYKDVASNKQWDFARFQWVADRLRQDDHRVVQLTYDGMTHQLRDVETFPTQSLRIALAVLARAALFIGHEGGMHHGAAALGIPAVVIFGGFVPPRVTGYDNHENMAAGGPACGSRTPCLHCRQALESITAQQVYDAARRRIDAEHRAGPVR